MSFLVSWAFSGEAWQKFRTAQGCRELAFFSASHVFFLQHARSFWCAARATNVVRTFRCYTCCLSGSTAAREEVRDEAGRTVFSLCGLSQSKATNVTVDSSLIKTLISIVSRSACSSRICASVTAQYQSQPHVNQSHSFPNQLY